MWQIYWNIKYIHQNVLDGTAIVWRTGNVEEINGGYSDPRLIDNAALMCIKMGHVTSD